MPNRRGAVVALALAATGGIGWWISRNLRPRGRGIPQASFTAAAAEPPVSAEERLRKDLDRLSSRVYSEEGIPMFLACENMVPASAGSRAPMPVTALNRSLAGAFRRDADAWLHIKPDAADMDVAKIIEVLADRDFASGGTEKNL